MQPQRQCTLGFSLQSLASLQCTFPARSSTVWLVLLPYDGHLRHQKNDMQTTLSQARPSRTFSHVIASSLEGFFLLFFFPSPLVAIHIYYCFLQFHCNPVESHYTVLGVLETVPNPSSGRLALTSPETIYRITALGHVDVYFVLERHP